MESTARNIKPKVSTEKLSFAKKIDFILESQKTWSQEIWKETRLVASILVSYHNGGK